jgi:hypothetical protein
VSTPAEELRERVRNKAAQEWKCAMTLRVSAIEIPGALCWRVS